MRVKPTVMVEHVMLKTCLPKFVCEQEWLEMPVCHILVVVQVVAVHGAAHMSMRWLGRCLSLCYVCVP